MRALEYKEEPSLLIWIFVTLDILTGEGWESYTPSLWGTRVIGKAVEIVGIL